MPTLTRVQRFEGPGLTLGHPGLMYFAPPPGAANFTVSGVTKDSAGVALAACVVQLFQTGDDLQVGETTSDGSGNYSFTLPSNSGMFYVVAYKAGSPDVSGTTVNTIVAV